MPRLTVIALAGVTLAAALATSASLKPATAAPLPGLAGADSTHIAKYVEKAGWRRWRYVGPHRFWWRRWRWRRW